MSKYRNRLRISDDFNRALDYRRIAQENAAAGVRRPLVDLRLSLAVLAVCGLVGYFGVSLIF
jgi:hypothetical protein